MIKIDSLVKKFNSKTVLDNINIELKEGIVHGLLGSNGSGKSTLMRTISGIYRPDSGSITVDDKETYENILFKESLFFVSDDPYFLPHTSINSMANFYKNFYKNWDDDTFNKLIQIFPLDTNARIDTFSKGMKRQALIILSLSTSPKYIFFDEAFDGLDPVMRNLLKKVISEKISDKAMTVIVSSHNINEFENMCDNILILHQGKKVLERSIDELEGYITKVQIAFQHQPSIDLFNGFNILNYEERGNLATLTIKGVFDEVCANLQALNPVFLDVIPTTLEEVFLYEMEAVGYNATKNI